VRSFRATFRRTYSDSASQPAQHASSTAPSLDTHHPQADAADAAKGLARPGARCAQAHLRLAAQPRDEHPGADLGHPAVRLLRADRRRILPQQEVRSRGAGVARRHSRQQPRSMCARARLCLDGLLLRGCLGGGARGRVGRPPPRCDVAQARLRLAQRARHGLRLGQRRARLALRDAPPDARSWTWTCLYLNTFFLREDSAHTPPHHHGVPLAGLPKRPGRLRQRTARCAPHTATPRR